MRVKLIVPETVTYRASITEEELRARLVAEMLEAICGADESGKALPGVKVVVHRGDSRKGGYTIDASGPAPTRLRLPPA